MTLKKPLATLWWINAALLGALVLWWFSLFRSDWQPPAPLIPDYSAVLDGALLPGQLVAQEYTAIIERPMFEIDRTWPKAPPIEQAPEPELEPIKEDPPKNALDDAVLQGIYDQAGVGIAIFSAQGKSHRLKMGESYEEWTMIEVTPMSASFSHPSLGEHTLTIKRRYEIEKAKKEAATTTAPAASNKRPQGTRLAPPQQRQATNNPRPAPPARPTSAPARTTPSADAPPSPGPTIGGTARASASSQ